MLKNQNRDRTQEEGAEARSGYVTSPAAEDILRDLRNELTIGASAESASFLRPMFLGLSLPHPRLYTPAP